MGRAYTSAKQRIGLAYLGVMKVTGKHLTLQRYLGKSLGTIPDEALLS